MQRSPRLHPQPYSGFQDLVVRVCRYWRAVAINTPLLWTYIFISQQPPHPLAEIYLARSGKCPLDIDIEMKPQYKRTTSPLNAAPEIDRALVTLRSIVAHGGTLDRWRSLVFLTKMPPVLFEVVGFINSAPTPALEFLSLKWKASTNWVDRQELLSIEHVQDKLGDSFSLSHGPQRPNLRRVDLDCMPSAFIFDRKSPFLSNLTRLKLVCAHVLYSIENISSLLAANPQLEHLTLHMGLSDSTSAGTVLTGPFQVPLPRLRYFSLNATNAYDWGVFLLQIVDAPSLETFEMHANTESTLSASDPATLAFMCIGRKNGALLHNGTNGMTVGPPVYGTPFPALKHFNLKYVNTGSRYTIRKLLDTYPTVTEVTASLLVLSALADAPRLLPNLKHLTYSGARSSVFPGMMQRLARNRSMAGTRLPSLTIEFTGRASPSLPDENEDVPVDYMAPLSELVGSLDIYDKPAPYVSDSDDDTDEDFDEDE
ncbi:hypothetical protein FRC10_007455 [Ceratobasidium sp. 414]|nr:hypothetical protein FRC10_007455 [Ceratobasidium sp. 414]